MLTKRSLQRKVYKALGTMPVLALLGPKQVGKTTLALEIVESIVKESAYLDLELDSDLAKLSDPEAYLRRFEGKLLIIDEVQRQPELFRLLGGLVDIRRRKGEKTGQFLLLSSASRDIIQHSSETLAGRIRFLELYPFSVLETLQSESSLFDLEKLWLRGGFPDSYLAATDDISWDWRSDFISSYVENDIPLMGPRLPLQPCDDFGQCWHIIIHNR